MALVEVGRQYFPNVRFMTGQANLLLNAANQAAGYVFPVPRSGSVIGAGFNTATITTGCTGELKLETLDAAGDPSGALYHANATVPIVIANGDDNVFKSGAFTPFDVVEADKVCLMFKQPAAAFMNGNLKTNTFFSPASGEDYSILGTPGAWVKGVQSAFALQYSDGWRSVSDGWLVNGAATLNVNTGTTPDEFGNRLRPPIGGRCIGMFGFFPQTVAFDVVLYDDVWNVLRTKSVLANSGNTASTFRFIRWPTTVILNKDTWYRVLFKAASGTNLAVRYITFPATAPPNPVLTMPISQASFLPDNVHRTQRTDSASPDDTLVNDVVGVGLVFDQYELGSAVSADIFGGLLVK